MTLLSNARLLGPPEMMLPSWKSRERLRGGGWLLPPARSGAFWRPAGNSWHLGAGTAAVGGEKHLPREQQQQLQKGKDKARAAGGAPRGARLCRGSKGEEGREEKSPPGTGLLQRGSPGCLWEAKGIGEQELPAHLRELWKPTEPSGGACCAGGEVKLPFGKEQSS